MLNLLHYRSWGREGFGLGYSSRDSWMRVPSLCPGVQGTSWIEPIGQPVLVKPTGVTRSLDGDVIRCRN